MNRLVTLPPLLCAAAVLIAAEAPATKQAGGAAGQSSTPIATTPPAPPAGSPATVKPASVPRLAPRHYRRRPPPEIRRVAAANRAATQEPVTQGYVNAAQVYPFSDGMIYRVYAAPERVTDVALQPGEMLGAVAAGDTVRWVIGDTTSGSGETKRTHVLIKPYSAGLSTNVVITTDRRSYHLSLLSTSATAMAAISWNYPPDALIAVKRQEQETEAVAPVARGLTLEQLSFGYTISGDSPAWRPLRAFDDGRQTFIEFPASLAVGEAPPLFVLGPNNEAELVNYRVRGRFYVVDRLFVAAELRLGTKHQEMVRITRDGADARGRRAS